MRLVIALCFLASALCCKAETISFGSGASQFTMDFVEVGNPGNAAATYHTWSNSVGRVDTVYKIGKYEVTRDQFEKAGLGLSLANLSSYGGNDPAKPATGMNWFKAAQFVNYLNVSQGYTAAYKFDVNGSFQLWSPTDAGYNAANKYRNTLAGFFLPNMDEWFKAGYYDPTKTAHPVFGKYWGYANQSDTLPTAVANGVSQESAVYGQTFSNGPAVVDNAGGLSYYGTMAQMGNVAEWLENAYDRVNDNVDDYRVMRGGDWGNGTGSISWDAVNSVKPDLDPQLYTSVRDQTTIGFRVVMIPEPSALSLLLTSGLVLILRHRKQLK